MAIKALAHLKNHVLAEEMSVAEALAAIPVLYVPYISLL